MSDDMEVRLQKKRMSSTTRVLFHKIEELRRE